MSELNIQTAQNVTVQYEPAGLGNRMLASLIDFLFKIAYVITLLISLGYIFGSSHGGGNTNTLIVLVTLTVILPYLLYDLLFEVFMQGQTPGKKILKIKVVKLDGTQPSVSAYLLRWLLRIVEIDLTSGMIAVISIATSKNSQRLGDIAAGTTVVFLKPRATLKDTILRVQQSEAYIPVFKEVALLSDKDIQVLKDVYDFYLKTGDDNMLGKLAVKIKAKTGIQTDMKNGIFIKTLIADYNHYAFL